MFTTYVICGVLIVIVFLGIRSYRKKLASGCCGSGGDAAPRKIKVRDRNIGHYPYVRYLHIEGMTCRNCAIRVQNALNSLEGVFSKVDLAGRSAVVRMKTELPEELLRKAISEAGYTASIN